MFANVTKAGVLALTIMAFLLPLQLWIGWKVAGKSTNSVSHYFIGGKQMGLVLVFFSDFATCMGVANFIGYSGKAYEIGLGQMWMVLGEQGSKIAFALLLARVAGKYAYNTLSEFMEKELFHDKLLRALTGIALLLPSICWTGAQAIGIGSMLSLVMGIEPTTGIWVASLFAIMYTVMGGVWAIAWTDLIQGIIRLVIGFIFFGSMWYFMGGPSGLEAKIVAVKPQLWTLGSAGFLGSLSLVLAPLTGMFTFAAYWQRCFSAKDPKTAKRAYLFTGIFAVIMTTFSVGVGLSTYALNPNLPQPDMAFSWLLTKYLSPWLAGLMVVTIVGASMTLSAGLLNTSVTLITMDVIKPYFRPNDTDRQLVQMARWLTLALGIAVVGVAFVFPTVISAGLWGYQVCGGGLFLPLCIGLLWKDQNGKTYVTKNATLASLLIGGNTAAVIQFVPKLMNIFGGGIIPGLTISAICTIGISLYERSKKPAIMLEIAKKDGSL
jgi:solute:Na+ symporter, SSS family